MSNDRYQKIRDALAMGPTPGPWDGIHSEGSGWIDIYQIGGRCATPIVYVPPLSVLDENGSWKESKGETVANARYVTACDPDTVRELLEERDALRERAGQLEYSNTVNADAKAQAAKHAEEVDRLRERVKELEADAARYRWGINNARWIRGEQEAYVAIPVAPDADLSCIAMRDAAIDAAMAMTQETSE